MASITFNQRCSPTLLKSKGTLIATAISGHRNKVYPELTLQQAKRKIDYKEIFSGVWFNGKKRVYL